MSYSAVDNFALTPAILLVLFACALLFTRGRWTLPVLFSGLAFTAVALWRQEQWLESNRTAEVIAFGGALTIDRFSLFFNALFLVTTALVAAVSRKLPDFSEYLSVMLFAQTGMFVLACSADLITIFLGLELMSLSFYVLAGFTRENRRSNEAAMKFLILGAFSSGLVVYGFSLLYGATGSTRLVGIAAALQARTLSDPLLLLALATTAAGLLFKVAAVPFHMWAPDAYEGAPAPVAAYLAVASTAASVAVLVRLLTGPLAASRSLWEPALSAVAIATLTLGNVAAIGQNNLKRLLAYSSISHAGYLLLGLIAGNRTGIEGISVYLITYVFMTVGAFSIVISEGEEIGDLTGLAYRNPWSAFLMLVFLLSLAGIPPTAGFLGKYYLLQALVETQHYALAAVGTLYVIVALYYYFRMVRAMFAREVEHTPRQRSTVGLRIALGASGLMTLAIGLYPEPFLRLAALSVSR